jgi:hypothetical protein
MKPDLKEYSLDQLKTLAEDLDGFDFDKRWGEAKLRGALDEYFEANPLQDEGDNGPGNTGTAPQEPNEVGGEAKENPEEPANRDAVGDEKIPQSHPEASEEEKAEKGAGVTNDENPKKPPENPGVESSKSDPGNKDESVAEKDPDNKMPVSDVDIQFEDSGAGPKEDAIDLESATNKDGSVNIESDYRGVIGTSEGQVDFGEDGKAVVSQKVAKELTGLKGYRLCS